MDINKWLDDKKKKIPLTEATIEKAIEIAIKEVKQRRKREQQNIRKSISIVFSLTF